MFSKSMNDDILSESPLKINIWVSKLKKVKRICLTYHKLDTKPLKIAFKKGFYVLYIG